MLIETIYDIAFKDSMTGWVGTDHALYKTIDGGATWSFCDSGIIFGIYYDSNSQGLFLSTYAGAGPYWGGYNASSWDEGKTWQQFDFVNDLASGGFAFANGDTGLITWDDGWLDGSWCRTTDGGHNWLPLPFDSNCWQPLAIPGTSTYFANTWWGTILRTDDAGITWDSIYSFGPQPTLYNGEDNWYGSSCIRGTLDSLYVMLRSGCYLSTTQGKSWKYLCGVPTLLFPLQRFYVKNNRVYAASSDSNDVGTIWVLNMDSLNIFSSSMPHANVSGTGNERSVTFQPHIESTAAVDTVHFSLRYDSSLLLDSLSVPANWHILDSSRSGNILTVTIFDTSTTVDTPSITLNFRHFVTPSQSDGMVWLDSARLFGKWMNCDIYAQSATSSDSVQLSFPNCADTILLDAMEGKPLFSIQSIVPNPFPSTTTISIDAAEAGYAEVSVVNTLGERVAELYAGTLASGNHSFTFDASNLPAGTYFCVMRSGGVSKIVPLQHSN